MDKKQPAPPAYITAKDSEFARQFGKLLFDKVKWTELTTKEVMEVYQLFMWYNTVPKKMEDNIMEPVAYKEAAPEPKKPTPTKKKTTRKKA